ncbi:tetratricopeptide repeat protein [Bauldia sp.]|uniref:tetratricopeptide repeat protein n=1 Tax=Bauldia sp. TaxID=2575872 RepID=UPI003BAA1EBB
MSDIFREVDEDIRRERYKQLWDRFGGYLIALAVLIVVATAGYRGWVYWQTSQAESTGDRFVAAITLAEEGRHDEAIAALSGIAEDGSGGYPILAAFRAAGEKAAAGNTDGALADYDALASQSGLPPLIGDMARLRAALLLSDRASAAELSSRIGDLAQTGNPWRHNAREILGFAAFRENDLTTARQYFTEIADDQETGQGARARAEVMLSLIASRQGEPVETEPAEG